MRLKQAAQRIDAGVRSLLLDVTSRAASVPARVRLRAPGSPCRARYSAVEASRATCSVHPSARVAPTAPRARRLDVLDLRQAENQRLHSAVPNGRQGAGKTNFRKRRRPEPNESDGMKASLLCASCAVAFCTSACASRTAALFFCARSTTVVSETCAGVPCRRSKNRADQGAKRGAPSVVRRGGKGRKPQCSFRHDQGSSFESVSQSMLPSSSQSYAFQSCAGLNSRAIAVAAANSCCAPAASPSCCLRPERRMCDKCGRLLAFRRARQIILQHLRGKLRIALGRDQHACAVIQSDARVLVAAAALTQF